MEIKAEVKSVEGLKDFFFVVPDYQREYVWEADVHVSRFLEDIADEFNSKTQKQSNYFIGSTIIVKRDDGMYDVVDGQQRLTTTIIALCAMRNALTHMDAKDLELKTQQEELLKVVQDLLYKYDIKSKKFTPRLSLQYEESKDYLTKLISKKEYRDENTPSVKKMMAAYSTIKDYLTELESQGFDALINYVGYFLANVEMVVIKPDDLGSALKIFETINERGVGLNAMDLLKNLLFSNAKHDEFEYIKKTWKEMQGYLDGCKEGDKPLRFLRYFLMARYHDGIVREDEIYKWMISEEGKSRIKYQTNPTAFVKELKSAANRYSLFVKATNAWDADAEYPYMTGIGYLGKKQSRQHLVLLLSLKETLGDSAANLLSANIESLIFYYSMNRVLTKSYEEKFANWASILRKVENIDDLKLFLSSTFNAELQEQQSRFNVQFATKSQGELNPQYRVKYILGRIEEFIRKNVNFPAANYGFYQEQHLEHILPQSGENIPTGSFPKEFDYETSVYRLGNLTLLEAPINQSINHSNDISSNEWFSVKKKAYLHSNILMTRTFSDFRIGESTAFNAFAAQNLKCFNDWNMHAIAERQEMLRKLILQIWKLYL